MHTALIEATRSWARRHSARILVGFVALAAIGSSVLPSALAGSVRGRVSGGEGLVRSVYEEAAKPGSHRYTWREWSPTVKAELKKLPPNISRDVCVAAVNPGGSQAHSPVLISLTGGHTVPTTIVVSPGTRLTFKNSDPFTHRLYAVGQATWRAENMAPNATRDWGAPPGEKVYEFRDELSPSVRLFVVVVPGLVEMAFPGRDGAYEINLPAGEYVLRAYFDGKAVGKALSVTAKERGTLDLKETLTLSEHSK
jgi:hypothetical protein